MKHITLLFFVLWLAALPSISNDNIYICTENSIKGKTSTIYPQNMVNNEKTMQDSKLTGNRMNSVSEELPIEIAGITVVPHYVSNEIPSYSNDQGYDKYGAHIRIFLKNNDLEAIDPEVLFNGKSGSQLFNEGIVSYCDVPEIRSVNNISHEVPGGGMDYYILNVMDSSFYSNGIVFSMTDKKTGRSVEKQLTIKYPEFYVTRIAFTSTQNTVFPDGFYIYYKNDSEKTARIDQIKIWSASNYYNKHYWMESFDPSGVSWFSMEGEITPGDLNGAHVYTGQLPFGELIVEVNYSIDGVPDKIHYPMKAMVIGYDLGMGWAVGYLTKSDAYCKTMAYMHLNTVNGGGMNDFYANQERAKKYPMKMFARLPEFSRTSNSVSIERIHGEESLGEPQFSKTPAQEIFNYYTLFRHSGFPSTVSLTHEPGFNAYAGVVDLNHFDSYRVVAPHADKWGDYDKYGDKNVRWGAPLETIGFYMRTLNRISYPNRVAAWTQAVSNAWSSFVRVDYPNDLEVRIQAYEAVANGATSLYWFTLSGKNIKNHRFSLAEIQRINREIMVVGDLLTTSAPYSWENKFMDIDLNVIAGPRYAALFAIDLKYAISKDNQFVSSGPRTETMAFRLPGYLHGSDAAVRIDHTGITPVAVSVANGIATITDNFTTTTMYILYNSAEVNMAEDLGRRYDELIVKEASYAFDPIRNNQDWITLVSEINKVDGVVDPPLGLTNTNTDSRISIYPNPSNRVFTLELTEIDNPVNLEIIDSAGKIILNRKIINRSHGDNEEKIQLPYQGAFIIKVSGENISYAKKIISY